MKKGQIFEGIIERVDFPNKGLVKVEEEGKDARYVTVKNAVPGQKVRFIINKFKKGNAEGRLLEVLENSSLETRKPVCSIFPACGGCMYQTMPYEEQMKMKEGQIRRIMDEAVDGEYLFEGVKASPKEFAYRNKMEFTFGDLEKGGELTLGMHMKGKSFGVLTVDNCMIVDEDFRKVLTVTVQYFRKKNLPYYRVMKREGYLRHLVVRKASNTGELMVNLVTTTKIDFDLSGYTELLKSQTYKGKLVSVLHTENDSFSDAVVPEKVNILYGRDYIIEELLDLKFKISPFSFFQTNSRGAESLYSIVRDFMGNGENKVVFDLYCGTGTIGQIAAHNAKKVIGLELIEEAVEAAKENVKLNGLDNCEFIAGDVAETIKQVKVKPDIIILDPPRSGVSPKALDYVIKFNAKEIIYVSCNPKTMVDNLETLLAAGYKVEKSKVKDMFPNTPHAEVCVKLVKQK